MPEYLELNTTAEREAELRGRLQFTRSQVALMLNMGPNVKVDFVETDMSSDQVTFHLSEKETREKPVLRFHAQGSFSMSEQPTDVQLLYMLETAAASLREKLTPKR